MSKYTKKIHKLQLIQTILIIICVIALAIYFYFISRPVITSFNITDECGPIGGTISHPIKDEDVCRNICNAYCRSVDKEFHDSYFELSGIGCNLCTCYCKE